VNCVADNQTVNEITETMYNLLGEGKNPQEIQENLAHAHDHDSMD